MTVREYVKTMDATADITFIKARARKDANTPFYHPEYQTTPIRTVADYESSALMDYYVINDKQCPIDWLSGAAWSNAFKSGRLTSLLIISKEDIEMLYSPKQAEHIIAYIDENIKSRK